jgi:hypothetical protein
MHRSYGTDGRRATRQSWGETAEANFVYSVRTALYSGMLMISTPVPERAPVGLDEFVLHVDDKQCAICCFDGEARCAGRLGSWR